MSEHGHGYYDIYPTVRWERDVIYAGDPVSIKWGKYKGFPGVVKKWHHDHIYTINVLGVNVDIVLDFSRKEFTYASRSR